MQELIKVKKLSAEFALGLDPSVRHKFSELQQAVREAMDRTPSVES